MTEPTTDLELTILMPCLNESETLGTCIKKAQKYISENKINGEVLIADNGSTDGSIEIAQNLGARVVNVSFKGYGSALRTGIVAAQGKYIIMGDSDDSYDFSKLNPFVDKLREGYDLVIGNRFKGGVEKGAMPFLHRYLGNPVLSFIGRVFFTIPVKDFHCGLRGFNRKSALMLDLKTNGMEFASEMVVKAALFKQRIIEVPTTLKPDGRTRPPHLRTWRDGWRHLRFLLIYSPNWLFFFPGLTLVFLGVIVTIILSKNTFYIGKMGFDVNTLFYASSAIIIGSQLIAFHLFSKIFAINAGLIPPDRRIVRFNQIFNLEVGIATGILLIVIGITNTLVSLNTWKSLSYGELNPQIMLRKIIPAGTFMIIGAQAIFYSFFISILNLRKNNNESI
jgi:glycosyltransferase involved in cell wall biosynthesis